MKQFFGLTILGYYVFVTYKGEIIPKQINCYQCADFLEFDCFYDDRMPDAYNFISNMIKELSEEDLKYCDWVITSEREKATRIKFIIKYI